MSVSLSSPSQVQYSMLVVLTCSANKNEMLEGKIEQWFYIDFQTLTLFFKKKILNRTFVHVSSFFHALEVHRSIADQMGRAMLGRPRHDLSVAGPGIARHAGLWVVPC